MKRAPLRHKELLQILTIALMVATTLLVIFLAIQGENFLTLQGIRHMVEVILSYGVWAPFAIIGLLIISTLIPPFPLPVPLVEIAAGLIFGFWPAFIVIWIAQIVSSWTAYASVRYVGVKIFKRLLETQVMDRYRSFIQLRGPIALFIIRAMMAAPFNFVSFLAGASQMNTASFLLATAAGTIPESVLFPYLGSIIKTTDVHLWYIFIFVIVLGAVGPLFMYFLTTIFFPAVNTKKRSITYGASRKIR